MAPPPVPIQGMNDMASQQRALQSYMDSMFASVPPPSTSTSVPGGGQAGGQQQQGNMMQQQQQQPQFNNAMNIQQNGQQQQMFHPGVPAIFQPGAMNSNNQQATPSSYNQMLPFSAQQSMPPPPTSQPLQQHQQGGAPSNNAWPLSQPSQQQQQQQQQRANPSINNNNNAKAGAGPSTRPQQLFNQGQSTLPQQSPQIGQLQQNMQQQQYSQAELQAMLASLAASQPQQQQQQQQQQHQAFQQAQQQRPNHIPNFPPSMSLTQQQPPQQQAQGAFQSQPPAPPIPAPSSSSANNLNNNGIPNNSQYPPHLQAAFQQLQAAHAAHSTPPPGAIQALAAFQQQQQAQAAQAAQQAQAAQHLQQQAQFQAQPSTSQNQAAPGSTPDISLLLKLRQQDVQLSAEQQMLLSRAMPRRGAVTGDPAAQPGSNAPQQAFNAGSIPSQMQTQQAVQNPQQQNMFQSPQLPNQQNGRMQPQQQQQHQQNQNALSLDIPNMQPINVQAQKRNNSNGEDAIPLTVLQEFTQMNDHLRQMTSQESHLQACLAQNLYLPYNKPGQPLTQAQPPPQPLTPQHREHFQKQMEQLRRIHAQVRENLAKMEEEWGGKDNIITNLRNMAYQRQMQQGGQGAPNMSMDQASQQNQQNMQQQQQQQQQPQHQQQQNFQQNQPAQMAFQQPPQQQATQQQQQPQSQEAAQLQKLLNRQQMRTPVNNFQQQNQQQSTPPQAQPPTLPQAPTQALNNGQPAHMQQQPQQVQQQGYPVPQNAAAAQAQAQLQRVVQMQQSQMANGPNGSPGSNMRSLPPTMPQQNQQQLSPALDKASLQSQQQQGNHNQAHSNSSHAQQQQLFRMQVAAVNEEILKTLTNAGPQTFMKALIDTMKHRGTPLTTFPKVDGKEVDLFRLYRVVQTRGGSAVIRQQGLWRQVALETGIPVSAESSQRVFEQMSKVYGDFLEAFEETQRRAAFATVSKHSLSQMPPPNMSMSQPKADVLHQNQQQGQQMQQGQQQQAMPQQPVPAQINMQNQQNQQQQYLQNIQFLQAQAQASLQGPGTPGQQQQQLPNMQQQQQQQQPQQQQMRNQQSQHQQQKSDQPTDGARAMSPPNQQPAAAQPHQNRLPNLPAPAEVTQARADIEEWKAQLLQSKPKCTRLDDFNPADAETFVNMAKTLAPMVDRIVELLPLYLAISKQPQGAHRLLVMLFMFKDQLNMLDRREFILRINDLEKLKMQMQRCWAFVSNYTTGNATSKDPPPYTEIPANVSNVPAPASSKFSPQQRSQEHAAGTPEFVGATMKAGIKVEDLKPPPVKKRRTGSPAGTPQSGPGQIGAKAPAQVLDQSNGAPGAGTYASPIALVDSPPNPPKKALSVTEGQGQPMAAKPKAGKKATAAQNKQAAPAPPASPAKTTKAKPKKAAAPASQSAVQDISVPEISMTPAATPIVMPPVEAPIPPRQQEESLKRKRELEEAQNDPAAFAERMFTSLLSSANDTGSNQQSSEPCLGEAFSSELLAFLGQQGITAPPPQPTFVQPAAVSDAKPTRLKTQSGGLNLIFDDPVGGSSSQPPSASRWFQDTPSVAAETPELSHSGDPTKTSPPDQDSVKTPSESLSFSHRVDSSMQQSVQSSSTEAILSSFDQEYEDLFKAATGQTLSTTQEGGSPAGLAWSWETGPVQVS
ncbi:hypothetical protein P389DRAFT_207384 [Cystobasidium minutum MCA 4210]|uniref:uncharacterized protein n=1 Tax=Cystobasidium minutum MCA 4210 TaxID=1397322 RepID=UPI0034CDBF4A|eukprot:jgi/Rhomi1/207384/estExt_Genemark1.C_1_t10280